MLAIERKNEIMNKLKTEQRVLVSELALHYGVTEETIRRDLDKLEKEGIAYVELGNPGIPHSVSELPHLYWDMADILRTTAKNLRFAPEYPKGANVNFYAWTSDTSVRIMTYERGVEDYTLACGTGCASTACVLYAAGKLPGGVLTAENKGGILEVTLGTQKGAITSVDLQGPAQVLRIFEI